MLGITLAVIVMRI